MADSLSDERLAEIDAMHADYKNRCGAPGAFRCCSAHPVADTVPELRAEVERLRAERDRLRADLACAYRDLKVCVGEQFTTVNSAAVEAVRRVAAAEADAANMRTLAQDGHAIAEQASALHRDARAELEQWHATFGETALRDGLARIRRVEEERDRLAEQARQARWAAAEMHEFNSPEGEHLPDCPGCRIERALNAAPGA